MSTPVLENIAANILTAINEITVGNGYNQTLTAYRPRRVDFSDVTPGDLKVIVKQDDPELSDGTLINVQCWDQPFTIWALVIDSDAATDSIDTRRNQVRSDIEKKLMVDPTRGGYAYETLIMPSVEFDDGGGFTGIAVNIIVKYRTRITDPYTKS